MHKTICTWTLTMITFLSVDKYYVHIFVETVQTQKQTQLQRSCKAQNAQFMCESPKFIIIVTVYWISEMSEPDTAPLLTYVIQCIHAEM